MATLGGLGYPLLVKHCACSLEWASVPWSTPSSARKNSFRPWPSGVIACSIAIGDACATRCSTMAWRSSRWNVLGRCSLRSAPVTHTETRRRRAQHAQIQRRPLVSDLIEQGSTRERSQGGAVACFPTRWRFTPTRCGSAATLTLPTGDFAFVLRHCPRRVMLLWSVGLNQQSGTTSRGILARLLVGKRAVVSGGRLMAQAYPRSPQAAE